MRFTTTLLFSLFWVLSSYAQEFGTHWVSYPFYNDSTEVLFRKVYRLNDTPQEAYISMASCGNVRLYVNERNVTGSIIYEGTKDNAIIGHTFNITPLLHKGDNVIAIWYAPKTGESTSKQLSLDFYGNSTDSLSFYHKADGTWWCKKLTDCCYGEKEKFDNRKYNNEWKAADYHSSNWIHPTGASTYDKTYPLINQTPLQCKNKLTSLLTPIETYQDSLGYHVDFERPFRGTIRLTIRGAHKGSSVYINGNEYICSGEMDEQAFYRFHLEWQHSFTINWGEGFKHSCITNIEGLEIE